MTKDNTSTIVRLVDRFNRSRRHQLITGTPAWNDGSDYGTNLNYAVRARMRQDWIIHRREIIRECHRMYGAHVKPWAQTFFGSNTKPAFLMGVMLSDHSL